MKRILVIDSENAIGIVIQKILFEEGYIVDVAFTKDDAFRKIDLNSYDLIVTEYLIPEVDSFELIDFLLNSKKLPVIIISGHGDIEIAVRAMKKGVFDYISKPPDLNHLLTAVKEVFDKPFVPESIFEISEKDESKNLIGKDSEIVKVRSLINIASKGDMRFVPVVISGETGVGKEVVAESIHTISKGSCLGFVPINCGAIPSELIESLLFGYEKGSFTGAAMTTKGYFDQANGGTLFLDEIGNASMYLQMKLLRVLQDGKYRRVGGQEDIYSNARILVGTNSDLKKMVSEGKFREDLYYRLKGMEINIPSLKERKDDIDVLTDHFFNKVYPGNKKLPFSNKAKEKIKNYDWPGNVRELFSALMFANAYALSEGSEEIKESHLQFNN